MTTQLDSSPAALDDSAPATIGDIRRIAANLRVEGHAGDLIVLDWSTSTAKRITIGAKTEFVFTNPAAGWPYTLEIEHDADGAPDVTWPSSVIWATPHGGLPRLARRRDVRDIVTLYFDGSNYVGCEYALGIPRARAAKGD